MGFIAHLGGSETGVQVIFRLKGNSGTGGHFPEHRGDGAVIGGAAGQYDFIATGGRLVGPGIDYR